MTSSPEDGSAGTSGAAHQGAADLDAAYRRCEHLARAHEENFPVVSRLLSREARRSLAAVYAFARAADDVADESAGGTAGPTAGERLAALDGWEARLRACAEVAGARSARTAAESGLDPFAAARTPAGPDGGARAGARAAARQVAGAGAAALSGLAGRHRHGGSPRQEAPPGAWRPDPRDADATFLALGDTIRLHGLDLAPFLDLLSAFRQDVSVVRYETRADLLDYCRRSADPVGRIVLAVHGARDERRAALSDRICTALQLANFWQDVSVDRAKGRVYIPLEDLRRRGVAEADLCSPSASWPLRALVLEEAAWARSLFEAGRPLLDDPPSGIGMHLRLVWHGGMRILELIEASGGDVLARRPRLGRLEAARLFVRALAGSRGSREARAAPEGRSGS